jgi:hypothetical protein
MVQRGGCSVNAANTDEARQTALHAAVVARNAAKVAFLVSVPGIDVAARDGDGLTARERAEALGFHDMVALLDGSPLDPAAAVEAPTPEPAATTSASAVAATVADGL